MKYLELVKLYQKLEKISGKLEKTDIIAEFLKNTPEDDLEKVILLLSGRVFPVWSDKELGIANQLMIKAISKAFGKSNENVTKAFNKIGDLGIVAEEMAKGRTQSILIKKQLLVENVFTGLQKIAEQSGAGSMERKLNLIIELIAQAKPEEAKYIVRTALEELRVGVAEGLIRDAIAKAFNVDVDLVEKAWFITQDYGKVAKIAKEKGENGLKNIKITLGNPIYVLLGEKAPSLKDALESYEKTAIEIKYDGARVQIHKKGNEIYLYTRRLENITKQFPDLVELARECIKAKAAIVEGEVIAIDKKTEKPLPFQLLSQRIKRKYDIEKMVKEIPIQVNIFDIIYLNGKDTFNIKFSERRKMLEKIIKIKPGKFQLAEQLITHDLKEAEKFYENALKNGQEGVMVKNLDAFYVPGRTVAGGWLKVKPTLENLDLVIVGASWGTGKRAGWLGSYILACRDPDTGKFLECGMLGTGIKEKKTSPEDFTMEEMTKLLKPYIESEKGNEVKIKPKIVIEVAYEEIQRSPAYSSGFALRFPRFVRLRSPEKGPEEADTIERIKHIYEIQKGGREKEVEK
ncbi:MAG: ATP-dependent DNA ligase [Candidatus Aenigmatarchaeota archaeon]